MHIIEYMYNNDDERITLDELHKIMEKEDGSGEVYCKRSFQRKLYAYNGSQVSIISSKQQTLIITLSTNGKQLIQEAHAQMQPDSNNMDSLVKFEGSYIQPEFKGAEKYRHSRYEIH